MRNGGDRGGVGAEGEREGLVLPDVIGKERREMVKDFEVEGLERGSRKCGVRVDGVEYGVVRKTRLCCHCVRVALLPACSLSLS